MDHIPGALEVHGTSPRGGTLVKGTEGSILEGGSSRSLDNCSLRQTKKKGPRASHGSDRSSGSGKIINGKKS